MLAETTAPRTRTPRTAKVAAPVTVRPFDVRAGQYGTLSSDGHTWYSTDVKHVTCTCKAGADGFARCKTLPYCRHMLAAKTVARALASMCASDRAAALAATTAIKVKTDVVMARMATAATPPPVAVDPAAALLECYPAA